MKDRKRNPDSRKNIVFNIQSIILSVLMAISLVTIIVMGLLLYHRFKLALEKTAVDNTEATVEATVDRLNADLLDIRQILNGANYNVVQQFDISSREFSEQFSLLYETNSDKIQSLACKGTSGYVEYARELLAGNFIKVRDHKKKSLGCGVGCGKSSGCQ